MIGSLLFASYIFTVGSIGWNFVKIRLQDDFEEQLKALREFDLATEKIDKAVKGEYIVLVNHKGVKENTAPIYCETVPYANLLDPTRFI